jgi:hypothetical protein
VQNSNFPAVFVPTLQSCPKFCVYEKSEAKLLGDQGESLIFAQIDVNPELQRPSGMVSPKYVQAVLDHTQPPGNWVVM